MGTVTPKKRLAASSDQQGGKPRTRRSSKSGSNRLGNLNFPSSRRLHVPPVEKQKFLSRFWVVVPICLIFGLALGVIVFGSLPQKEVPLPPPDPLLEPVTVDVPARIIPAGARLRRSDFRQTLLTRGDIREGSAISANMIIGKYTRVELESKKPVFLGDLSNKPTFKTFQAQIPVGHRGITIAVDATGGIEGWSRAGAHVDVIVSYLDKKDGKKKTQTAVENALVLSFKGMTSQMIEADTEAGLPPIQTGVPDSGTVTLAVPVKDALRIQTAKMLGQISLLLRNPRDAAPTSKKVVTPEDLRRMAGTMSPPMVSVPKLFSPPVIQRTIPTPDGFAKFKDLKSGEIVELELYGLEWKKSPEADY